MRGIRRSTLPALLLSLILACARSSESPRPSGTSGLAETSTSFDQEEVGDFLAQLAAVYPQGFGKEDAARVTSAIKALPVDSGGSWEFRIVADGRSERLVIAAFQDDVNAPDLYFYSTPDVVATIGKMLASFEKAHGK